MANYKIAIEVLEEELLEHQKDLEQSKSIVARENGNVQRLTIICNEIQSSIDALKGSKSGKKET